MKQTIATAARRAGLWTLLAARYRKLADEQPKRRDYWLARAAEAEQTAAA